MVVRTTGILLLLIFFVTSCKTARNGEVVRNNLATGYKSCIDEMRRLSNQQILDDHVKFLGSYPRGVITGYTGKGYLYDKKFKTIPGYYSHGFQLRYDSLISYEFHLTTDSTGQFPVAFNNKYRDYVWLKGYFALLMNKDELETLIKTGVTYFSDDRFEIFFSHERHVSDERRVDFTKQELMDIRNDNQFYELIDRDRVHDVKNQKYERKGIVVDPRTKKIMTETLIINQYIY